MDDNVLFSPQPQNASQGGQSIQGKGSFQSDSLPHPTQAPLMGGQITVPVATSSPQAMQNQSLQQPQGPGIATSSPQQTSNLIPTQPSLQGNSTPPTSTNPVFQAVSPSLPPTDIPPSSLKVTLEDLYGPSQQDAGVPTVPIPPVSNASSFQTETSPQTQQPASSGHEPIEAQPFVNQPLQTVQQPLSVSSPQKFSPRSSDISDASVHKNTISEDSGGGGFHFPPLIFKIVGGLFIVIIVLFVISFVSSLFHNKSGNEKVTLTYWGLWEDSSVMQGVINDFERQNPNITIQYSKEDPVKYTDRLLTRIQNGSGPDIFRFHNSWVTPLESVLLPLPSTVIDKQYLQDNYFPTVSNDLVDNGAIYGIPLEMDNLVLYTNKDIFDHAGAKVPASWEDFVTVSKGLTVKDPTGHIKTAGAALGTYNNISHAPDIMSLLFLQNGANLRKLQGSQNALDALNFYTSFAKTDDRVWDSTLDNSLLAFSRGNLAMYFGYSYDYFAIKAAAPQLNFEVHAVPHLPGRDMSVASYWVEGVSNKSSHQKEALLFLKYLTQKDVIAKLYTEEAKMRQFGEIYPRKDLASTLSSDPILATFVNQSGKAVSSFFISDTNYDSFNGSLNQYLGNAINSLLGDTSADTALTTLSQGVSQVLNQYVNSSQ